MNTFIHIIISYHSVPNITICKCESLCLFRHFALLQLEVYYYYCVSTKLCLLSNVYNYIQPIASLY